MDSKGNKNKEDDNIPNKNKKFGYFRNYNNSYVCECWIWHIYWS